MSEAISKESKIYVAGHRGLIGTALLERLNARDYCNVVFRSHDELDLTNQSHVMAFFQQEQPEFVIFNAAIPANSVNVRTRPVQLMLDNTLMIANVIDASLRFGAKKLIYVCSHAAYPSDAQRTVDGLLPEESMQPGAIQIERERYYAMPKLLGKELCRTIDDAGQMRCVTAVLANVYGNCYHYETPDNLPVFPALLKRFCDAVKTDAPEVVIWGSGNLRRDLLTADDVAEAYLTLLEAKEAQGVYNISSGTYITIREMAETVRRVTGYSGNLVFDTTKPEGVEFPLLQLDRIKALGWKPEIPFEDGVRQAYAYYQKNFG
ncbi:NAD-dependent epimerase/dehydratase family protein [Oscillibacter sp.]|uniref:NAD-dependent epimerase/dehydratase family protein n=1 Tax=Oscillibacter sp. TaxID=1945593 RepID=UPI0028AA84A6|nr:NAD-dependent epimerase/dehydratase family protein [Oscillibacter sp.]